MKSRPSPHRFAKPITLLALLIEHFGDAHQAVRFLRAFSGIAFVVPTAREIETLARALHITSRLKRDASTETVRRLAQFHGVTTRDITKDFQHITGKTIGQHRASQLPKTMTCPHCSKGYVIAKRLQDHIEREHRAVLTSASAPPA